jgi:hypothetical protein
MRSQIAYALLALTALLLLVLLAKSRTRRASRARKHLRIDLLSSEGKEAPQPAADAPPPRLP